MEAHEQKYDVPELISSQSEHEKWGEFEPTTKINGIGALIRNWNVEVNERGNVIKTMQERRKIILPRIEKRALIILPGGRYGYGGCIDQKDRITGEKKYAKIFPEETSKDTFSNVYFALQKLVNEGILTPPLTGDDGPTLNDFFWETTKPMETAELISIIRQKTGLSVEKQ